MLSSAKWRVSPYTHTSGIRTLNQLQGGAGLCAVGIGGNLWRHHFDPSSLVSRASGSCQRLRGPRQSPACISERSSLTPRSTTGLAGVTRGVGWMWWIFLMAAGCPLPRRMDHSTHNAPDNGPRLLNPVMAAFCRSTVELGNYHPSRSAMRGMSLQ